MNAGRPGNAKCGASIKDNVISSDRSASMQANLDLGGNKIASLADPAEPQEAATKCYVDSRIHMLKATDSLPPAYNGNYIIVTLPEGKGIFNGKIVILGLLLLKDTPEVWLRANKLRLTFGGGTLVRVDFELDIDRPIMYRLQYFELP